MFGTALNAIAAHNAPMRVPRRGGFRKDKADAAGSVLVSATRRHEA